MTSRRRFDLFPDSGELNELVFKSDECPGWWLPQEAVLYIDSAVASYRSDQQAWWADKNVKFNDEVDLIFSAPADDWTSRMEKCWRLLVFTIAHFSGDGPAGRTGVECQFRAAEGFEIASYADEPHPSLCFRDGNEVRPPFPEPLEGEENTFCDQNLDRFRFLVRRSDLEREFPGGRAFKLKIQSPRPRQYATYADTLAMMLFGNWALSYPMDSIDESAPGVSVLDSVAILLARKIGLDYRDPRGGTAWLQIDAELGGAARRIVSVVKREKLAVYGLHGESRSRVSTTDLDVLELFDLGAEIGLRMPVPYLDDYWGALTLSSAKLEQIIFRSKRKQALADRTRLVAAITEMLNRPRKSHESKATCRSELERKFGLNTEPNFERAWKDAVARIPDVTKKNDWLAAGRRPKN